MVTLWSHSGHTVVTLWSPSQMLCGKPPFLQKDEIETLNMIKKKPKVQFNGKRWSSISKV